MADEQIRIDVTAKDDASKVLEDVADAAKDLEKIDPEVTVGADTAAAESAIADVKADAEALSAEDRAIVLRARIDDAKGELKSLRDDLEQTGEKAEATARSLDRVGGGDGGALQTRGNAIADLTGPLGEASSAASDFAGVFDGLGDIATDFASKLGASDQTVSKVAGAMGGLGIAVAAGASLWALYKDRQQKAREEAERMLGVQKKLNDALTKQDPAAWAEAFEEGYGGAVDAADRLGVSVGDVTRYVTGQIDAIPGLADKVATLRDRYNDGTTAGQLATIQLQQQLDALEANRQKYGELGIEAGKVETTQERIAAAMPGWSNKTDGLTESNEELADANADAAEQTSLMEEASKRAARQADATRDAYDRLRGALDMQETFGRWQESFLIAANAVQTGADDAATKVRDLKNTVIDAAEQTGQNPIEVASTLQAIDQGDFDKVRSDVEGYYNRNPIPIKVKLNAAGATSSGSGGGGILPTSAPPTDGGGGTTIVNMSVPRGYRGDLLADARSASRRTGRRYQRAGG